MELLQGFILTLYAPIALLGGLLGFQPENATEPNLGATIAMTRQGGTATGTPQLGGILYSTTNNLWTVLPPGSDGQVLKLASGFPSWGTDSTGSSGGSNWTDNGSYVTPTTTARGLLINSASSTITNLVISDGLSGTGFSNAWDTRFSATSTWAGFTSNWNTLHNATTTYPGFASQFETAFNATTTLNGFTPHDAVTLAGTPDYLTISGQQITRGTIDVSDDTNLAVSGTLLNKTGDTLSVNEGTLTNTFLCTYVTGTGLVCNTDPSSLSGSADGHFAQATTTNTTGGALVPTTNSWVTPTSTVALYLPSDLEVQGNATTTGYLTVGSAPPFNVGSGSISASNSLYTFGGYGLSQGTTPYWDLYETDTSKFGGMYMSGSNLHLYTDTGNIVIDKPIDLNSQGLIGHLFTSVDDTYNIGSNTIGWANLYLSSGAEILWNNTSLLTQKSTTGIGVGNASANGVVSSRGNFDLVLETGNGTTGNLTIQDGANGNILLSPNGSGSIYLQGNASTTGSLNIGTTLGTISLGAGDLFIGRNATTTNNLYVGGNLNAEVCTTANIIDATSTDELLRIGKYFTKAATITEVTVGYTCDYSTGGCSSGMTFNFKHSTDISSDTSANNLFTAAQTMTNNASTTPETFTSFNDATVPANSHFWFNMVTASTTQMTNVMADICYRQDS